MVDFTNGHNPFTDEQAKAIKLLEDAGYEVKQPEPKERYIAVEVPSPHFVGQYKLLGGVNWFDCRLIASHDDKYWFENKTSGTCPILDLRSIKLRRLALQRPKPPTPPEPEPRIIRNGRPQK